MTISQQTLTSESLLTGTPHERSPVSAEAKIYTFEARAPIPAKIPNTISIDSLVAEFEQDTAMADALAAARRKMATEGCSAKAGTLAYMRLQAGLSQSQLAAKVGTSQSHIARIEAGKNDPSTEMIGKLAVALKVSATVVFETVYNQIKQRA